MAEAVIISGTGFPVRFWGICTNAAVIAISTVTVLGITAGGAILLRGIVALTIAAVVAYTFFIGCAKSTIFLEGWRKRLADPLFIAVFAFAFCVFIAGIPVLFEDTGNTWFIGAETAFMAVLTGAFIGCCA